MNLYIFRHAWAGEAGDPNYPDDSLRPLTEDGKVRFRIFVTHLIKTRALDAQIILSSPYARCLQTSQILSDLLPGQPPVQKAPALAMGSHLTTLVSQTNSLNHQKIIWVGHNPDVGLMTSALSDDPNQFVHFSKGACAALVFTEHVITGFGDLNWFESPKEQGF